MANYDMYWRQGKRVWTVKTIDTSSTSTAAGMKVGDIVEFVGLGDGTTASKLMKGNPSPSTLWGDRCKTDPNPAADKITLFVGGQEYNVTREIVVRLVCRPKASGSVSWTAEEGGP